MSAARGNRYRGEVVVGCARIARPIFNSEKTVLHDNLVGLRLR
jgi:hypothetical protein